jgi:hypothetical protein
VSTASENLTDPEREHFVRQIRDLEGRLRRWRLACLALLGLLLLPILLGGLLGVWWVPRLERERAARLDMERARDLLEVERLRVEVERQRAVAEEEARRQAQQGPGEGKD